MRSSYLHKLRYIHWAAEAEFVLLDNATYARKLAWLKKEGKKVDEKTLRAAWIQADIMYRQDKSGKYEQLYTREHGKYYRYSTNTFAGGKVINPGRDAYNAVVERLKENIGEKRNVMMKFFGHTDPDFKRCIPKQFYHINERYIGKKIYGVSGIDFSSHYPANICGRLPDANGAKVYAGTVPPTEEFPFAFYVRSGHSSELGVYDTHEWLMSDFSYRLFEKKASYDWNLDVSPDDDTTVLMPASEATLDEIIQHFYDKRNEKSEYGDKAKLVMNAFIGYLHKAQNYEKNPYAHLAAVCLARANNKMLRAAEQIGYDKIVQICIDGCIYKENKSYGVAKKSLGACVQEFRNCVIQIEGTNKYLIKDSQGNVIKSKIQGCNQIDGEDIDIDFIPDWDDLKKLSRKVVLE